MCKKLTLLGCILLIVILIQARLFAEETGNHLIKNFKVSVKDFISLTWDSPGGDIHGYNLYRSSSADILGKKINRKILSNNKYIDYSAGTGKIHYYQVYALDKEKNLVAFSTPVAGYISPFYSVNIWTPTAFQSKKMSGEHLIGTKYLFAKKPLIGLNTDFILNYYIGRLFGTNERHERQRYDYITRIGIWLLTGDIKMVLPYLEKQLFSLAIGARYTYMFRDIPQPSPGATPTFTVKLQQSQSLASVYIVMSKSWTKNALHIGFMEGKEQTVIPHLSEYVFYREGLPPDNPTTPNRIWRDKGQILFFGLNTRMLLRMNLKVEAIYVRNNPLQPWLFNFDIGRFLPINFQLAYFRYKYGWDILGYFNYRYTFYPPQK